jgi:serine/threonine-protein kinase
LARVAQCEIPDILDLRPELPAGLRDILDRALAADREDRYGSAREMLKDLRALLRKIEDEQDDPRATVVEVMERFFTGRIEYIRATVRGAAESGRAHRSSRNLSAAARAAALRAGVDDTLTPAASASERARLLGGTGTLTTSLAEAPARHWSLWLLLPLVGAAIGTAVVSYNRSDGIEAAPRKTEDGVVASVDTPEASLPAHERAIVPDALEPSAPDEGSNEPAARLVKWWFNTDPDGATITIDGKPYDAPTPVSIELPRSEQTVVVRIEKQGYMPRVLHLAPLEHDNHYYRLEPTSSVVISETKKSRARLKTRPKGTSKDDESSDGAQKKGPEDGRTLEDMPDFRETAGG